MRCKLCQTFNVDNYDNLIRANFGEKGITISDDFLNFEYSDRGEIQLLTYSSVFH